MPEPPERVDPDPASVDSPSPSSQDAVLLLDLPCVVCGYNLRGLSRHRHCPECNAPLSASLVPGRLIFADPAWLKRIAQGLMVTIWSLILTVVLVVGLNAAAKIWRATGRPFPGKRTVAHSFDGGFATGSYNWLQDVVPLTTNSTCIMLVMIGLWLCTRPPPKEAPTRCWSRRCVLRILILMSAASALAPFVLFEQIRIKVHKMDMGVWVGSAMPNLRMVLEIAADVGLLLVAPVFMYWMAGLVRQLPSTRLVRWLTGLGIAFALLQALVLFIPVAPALAAKAFGWSVFDVTQAAYVVVIAAIAAILWRVRRRLKGVIPTCVPISACFP